jgi:hypothetical protein
VANHHNHRVAAFGFGQHIAVVFRYIRVMDDNFRAQRVQSADQGAEGLLRVSSEFSR